MAVYFNIVPHSNIMHKDYSGEEGSIHIQLSASSSASIVNPKF